MISEASNDADDFADSMVEDFEYLSELPRLKQSR